MQEGENLNGYRGGRAGAPGRSGDESGRSRDGNEGDGRGGAEVGGLSTREEQQVAQESNSQFDRRFIQSNEAQRRRIGEASVNQEKRSRRNK